MDKIKSFKEIIEKISKETGIEIPQGYKYRYAPYLCWKCNKRILIFNWTNPLISGPIDTPPEPIPKTLQKRYTAMSNETYWANVCPFCDSVQGDFYINCEPESPLIVIGEIIDDKESFDKDLKDLANYYFDDPNCIKV